MEEKVCVNYDELDKCISNLETITFGVGGDEIRKMIDNLKYSFINTSSDISNELLTVAEYYNKVNNTLINISCNLIEIFRSAKNLFEDMDEEMFNTLQ